MTYTTGDVEIEANGSASATLTAASNLAPGDTTFRPVSVTNVGSLDLRYAVSGVTTSETKNLVRRAALHDLPRHDRGRVQRGQHRLAAPRS